MSDTFSGKTKKKRKLPNPPLVQAEDTEYELALKSIYGKLGMVKKCEKLVVEQPTVLPLGTKTTVFVNLARVSRSMEREPSHLSKYLGSEHGTKAFVTSEGQYVVKRRFRADQVKKVTTDYVREYVLCYLRKLHKTKLVREGRLTTFLQCELCNTSHIKTIEAGFVASTQRRGK